MHHYSKSLQASIKDGCAHAMMLGCGETYLMAYAVFLGSTEFVIGVLASLPLFIGSLSQLAAVSHLDGLYSRKGTVVMASLFQGLCWLLILIGPILFSNHVALVLIICFCLYHLFGHFGAPLWNSWMGDLVPPDQRGHYFGLRNRLRVLFELIPFIMAGLVLFYTKALPIYWGYGLLFLSAMVFRLISAAYQSRMVEPGHEPLPKSEHFSLLDFIKVAPKSNFAKFTFYVALVLFVTNICSPFFTLYQLRDLHFSYLQFMLSLAASLLFQFITFQSWGKIGDRYGNLRVVRLTAFFVVALPFLWLLTNNFYAILVFQALGGALWAGFNLCCVNFLFDAVTPQKRGRCVAYFNFICNLGILCGALTGGWLATVLPSSIHWGGMSLTFVSNICLLFAISTVGRFFVSFLFSRFIKEVRKVEPVSHWQVVRHMIGLSLTPEFSTRFVNIFFRSRSARDD